MSSVAYNLHDIVRVSFTRDFSPKFIPEHFRTKKVGRTDLVVDERPDIKFDKARHQHMEHFYGGDGELYFERPRYGVLTQKMLIDDLFGRSTFSFTRSTRLAKIGDIVSLIGLLLEVKLLQRGYTLVHGAGVSKGGKGYLISGWGGTGKTSALIALSRQGFKLLGDEMVILSKDGTMYSFPSVVSIHPDTANVAGLDLPLKKRVKGSIKRTVCRISPSELPLSPAVDTELSKIGEVIEKAKLDGVFLLEKGTALRREKMGKEEAVRKFVGMNKLELLGQSFPLKAFIAYCYLNDVDPQYVEKNMEDIFRRTFSRCYMVKGGKTQHYKLIMEGLPNR